MICSILGNGKKYPDLSKPASLLCTIGISDATYLVDQLSLSDLHFSGGIPAFN